jgi:hypothetical protein
MKILATVFVGLVFVSPVMGKSIAVTDLAYSERLEEYIHTVDYHNTTKIAASSSSKAAASGYAGAAVDGYGGGAAVAGYAASSSSKSKLNASSKTDYHEYEHNFSYVEYGELKKFTGDIKGELINSRQFTLTQAKPAPTKRNEAVYDIIARIKKGDFAHADYVLFGRLNEMSFSDSTYQVSDSMTNIILSLTLTAEFSLINTKNYQVIASFTATGDGQDTKIITPGTYAEPNRPKVIALVSKSLGQDVFRQIEEQVFDQVSGEPIGRSSNFDSQSNNGIEPPPQKPKGVTVFQ